MTFFRAVETACRVENKVRESFEPPVLVVIVFALS